MKQLLLLIIVVMFSRAQDVSVTATVDSQSVELGGWIRYEVAVKHPSATAVVIPSFRDSIGGFEIVLQDTMRRTEEQGTVTQTKLFTIAKYEPGSFMIAPFAVRFRAEQGDTLTAASNPIPVEIRGVEVDTSQTIRDLKPTMSVPMSAEEIAAYVAIAAALAGLAYGVYYYMKKRKHRAGEVPAAPVPNIPPHVLALMQLEQLEAKRLWQSGEIKAFYSEATEIVRRYFEQRYGIMALEMTSGEVMAQLQRCPVPPETVRAIETFLSGADLVKFAKYQPVAGENEQVITDARMIVEATKPSENPVAGTMVSAAT